MCIYMYINIPHIFSLLTSLIFTCLLYNLQANIDVTQIYIDDILTILPSIAISFYYAKGVKWNVDH